LTALSIGPFLFRTLALFSLQPFLLLALAPFSLQALLLALTPLSLQPLLFLRLAGLTCQLLGLQPLFLLTLTIFSRYQCIAESVNLAIDFCWIRDSASDLLA
jgi:hypothetical protein